MEVNQITTSKERGALCRVNTGIENKDQLHFPFPSYMRLYVMILTAIVSLTCHIYRYNIDFIPKVVLILGCFF